MRPAAGWFRRTWHPSSTQQPPPQENRRVKTGVDSSHALLKMDGDRFHCPFPPPVPLPVSPDPPMPSRLRDAISATMADATPTASTMVRGLEKRRSYVVAKLLRRNGTASPSHLLCTPRMSTTSVTATR